uniref:C4-dicarboxylate ABC transporter permease n=1 Tax=Ignisphaera aggregans TaxID=334771 RepID=A0A7J3I7N3_9CREN
MVDWGFIFSYVISAKALIIMFITALYGLFIGAMPGLTATMAAALLVPFAFWLDPLSALAMIITMDVLAIWAGDIPAAFVRIPGTPASAAYADEMYEMTKRGKGQIALAISLMGSTLGGLIGVLVLAFFSPELAKFALNFSSAEFFWLVVFGLINGVLAVRGSPAKRLFSLLLGILIALVGFDPVFFSSRLTFGRPELLGGLNYIPILIGVFGMSEVLKRTYYKVRGITIELPKTEYRFSELVLNGLRYIKRFYNRFISGSTIGVIIGALPGAGADIAAWLSYNLSYRFSRNKDSYGKGSEEGILAATSANNASLAGAWIPSLVFGIPGDSVTAIVLGVMMMKGIIPGPRIFIEQATLVYSLFIIFTVANLLIIPLGLLTIKFLGRVFLRTPDYVLVPMILVFCVIGSYAIDYSFFSVLVMLVFGVMGFFMDRYGYPYAPMVLGVILGKMLETYFVMTYVKGGVAAFFNRPLSLALFALTLFVIFAPWIGRKVKLIKR